MDFKDAVKTKNIIKVSPDDTLSHVLGKLGSSHDCAFVFDDEKNYLGVINPYYTLIKKSYPGNAKVAHCLFHAPRVYNTYSVSKVARLFVESKLHYLPIFDDKEKFVGISSARRLLSLYQDSDRFHIEIGDYLKQKKQSILSIYDTDLVSSAVHTFKSKRISKLVVLSKDMRLKGILTYYDLISHLMTPKRKEHKGDKIGDKRSFQYLPVKNFAKTYLLTLGVHNTLFDALKLILDKQIGSVLIVDDRKLVIGIITTSDFLRLLSRSKEEQKIEISGKNLSTESSNILRGFMKSYATMIKKLPDVKKIKLFIHEEKNGGIFKTVLSVIPKRGRAQVIANEEKSLQKSLKEIQKKVKRANTD